MVDEFQASVAAGTHAWLSGRINERDPAFWDQWWRLPGEDVGRGETISIEPWPHDFWVSQGVRSFGDSLFQTWSNRRSLDEWPLLEADTLDFAGAGASCRTNAPRLDRLLAAAEPLGYAHARHLETFLSYVRDSEEVDRRHARIEHSPARVKANIVRAWLDNVLGSALGGLVLSPTDDEELLTSATFDRLDAVWRLHASGKTTSIFLAAATDSWCTAQWTNLRPAPVTTHQGQPIWTRNHWHWLGQPLPDGHLLDALKVTAGLLVSPPILDTLLTVARSSEPFAVLAVCALRRWALGLRAMAWLEEALSHPWVDVRTADLVGFAYASLLPWWPRPSVAVSHRSRDVKRDLLKLSSSRSAHVAIDAMTVPVWETTTGLVWRLFAPTPTVVRVNSDGYGDSVWCRREAELLEYLRDRSDFLRDRTVVDVSPTALTAVDRSITPVTVSHPANGPANQVTSAFPPVTLVLEVPQFPPLLVNLLAAVCTLRLLHGLIGDVREVNRIAANLARGRRISLSPPTNEPGGWRMHYDIFTTLAEHNRMKGAPVRLAPGYPESQRRIDIDNVVHRVPDFAGIACGAVDVLAALEWDREIRPWFSDRWHSYRAVVDCRETTSADWAADPRHSVRRGILELSTDTMVFILQNAGDSAEDWPVIADRDSPILTQYVTDQFPWLARAFMLPTWIAAYLSLPEFAFGTKLTDAAFGALDDEFAAYPKLTAPSEYSDVFATNVGRGSPFADFLETQPSEDRERTELPGVP